MICTSGTKMTRHGFTNKGSVFSYNLSNEYISSIQILEPKKTCSHGKEENGKKVNILHVSAGVDHILYLSTKRELWVQGKGPALGLFTNKIENEIANPTRVDFFKGRKVLQAAAGHYFTVALVEALPSIPSNGTSLNNEPITDLDSYVRVCEHCRKETGDRVLFEDVDEIDKCPLGLGVQRDAVIKGEFLSPTPSSCGFDGRLSRSSNVLEDCESSDYLLDIDLTSGDTSCNGTTLNSPTESKISLEMKTIPRLRKHSSVDGFEMLEGCVDNSGEKSVSAGALTMTRDVAKQIFSRPLSWVTSSSLDSDTIGLESEKFSYKYPIDSATELIKENVVNAASLVATSVKTVGDKVGQLSRHFSSSDCAENSGGKFSPDGESLNIEIFQNKPTHNISKSETHDWNSLPRQSNFLSHKKTHIRTASAGKNYSKISKENIFVIEKNIDQIEKSRRELIESGKNILNSEVWGWGSSNKGQLGLGDQSHRTTPTNITSLNHAAVRKVVCGSHHTAALTIDGQESLFQLKETLTGWSLNLGKNYPAETELFEMAGYSVRAGACYITFSQYNFAHFGPIFIFNP
ncbi:Alsin [Armadillidium nasatum]|uniref:Alsin n=1 Tax=Armadillidium nasatum TaxID=96803 RepID=A0A5N5SZI6_9CRUS|nr:Alsin [Armadillidium nasatum]